MKKLVLLIFTIILAFSTIKLSYGQAKISAEVYKELNKTGFVNVIIDLSNNVNKKNLSQIKSLPNFRKLMFRDLFTARVTAEQLHYLEKLNATVYLDEKVKTFLQDSTIIINATEVWKLNITGLHQTVCIIDTGVNYSHPDLGGCYGNNNVSSNCKIIGGYDFVNNDSDPMDDNGHGTHVAGIVAANGGIKGIAPNAKIIMIKALDENGSGFLSDIMNGIYWCTNNASRFNITVISMSLGTDTLYNSQCDSQPPYPPITQAVNNAIAHNIAVIAATGNSGNTTSIAAPACISNVTAIAATTKNDVIAGFSNRNNITDLVAPGENINSTHNGGGYIIKSGTSMATPHVAGAIALINQRAQEKNEKLNPKQIVKILKDSGKKIYDDSTNLSFPRINILEAIKILELNITELNVTPVAYKGENIIIKVTVTGRVNKTYAVISNSTWNETSNMTEISNASNWAKKIFVARYNTTNLTNGQYNVTVYVESNISSNISISKTSRFKLTYPINLRINITNSSGNTTNLILEFWNSGQLAKNFTINTTLNKTLAAAFYNITIKDNSLRYYITIIQFNLTNSTNLSIIFENINVSKLPKPNSGIFKNYAFLVKHDYNYSNKICFNISNINFQKISNAKIYKCEWNISAENCSSKWQMLNTEFAGMKACSISNNLSVFVVGENPYCGDNFCDSSESCSSCSSDCGNCRRGGSGYRSNIGGKSIRGTAQICTENWICSEWSECVNGSRTRECIDLNNCGTTLYKPTEEKNCTVCIENWSCNEWSECVNGSRTRECIDLNNCGTKKNMPITKKTCFEIKKEKREIVSAKQFEINKKKIMTITIISLTSILVLFLVSWIIARVIGIGKNRITK